MEREEKERGKGEKEEGEGGEEGYFEICIAIDL